MADIPEIMSIINNKVCSQRDRGILQRVKVDGISYETVAEEYSICRNTVYNVVRRHKDKFI